MLAFGARIRHLSPMKKATPRLLDHIVLPVPGLPVARKRFEQLGFAVAPAGRHSFGSENCCIYFANGTFIEPLAIGHRETVEAAILKGNPFLSRDMAYRFRHGDNGFSMVVFTGSDARKDRKSFAKSGYETGKIVKVKRPGVKVRGAFAIDPRAPDLTLFRCERPDGPPSFPDELTRHLNGAVRLANVALYEDEPTDFQYYLQTASGVREIRSHSFGFDMQLPNATLTALNESGMQSLYGISELPPGRGMRAMAFDVEVADLGATEKWLGKNGVTSRIVGQRLIVDPDQGQGAILAFVGGSPA